MSISAVVILAAPLASRDTEISCVTTVGSISSTIVTVAVSVAELVAASDPVNVTTTVPISVQSNELISIAKVRSQLSEEPPSISAAVIVAAPLMSSTTVMS